MGRATGDRARFGRARVLAGLGSNHWRGAALARPELNRLSWKIALARLSVCLAGGSRERLTDLANTDRVYVWSERSNTAQVIHAWRRSREPPADRPLVAPRFLAWSCRRFGSGQKRLPSRRRGHGNHPQSVICHLSSVISYFFCRGSNASRRPSPRKLRASNVLAIAIAGKTNNHQ